MNVDTIARMIERESLGGPLEDRPLLASSMFEDLHFRSEMGMGLWEVFFSEGRNEEERARGGEESGIWEKFLIDIRTEGFDEADNLSDPYFLEHLADPTETGPAPSHMGKDSPPEIANTDVGLAEGNLDERGIWEHEDLLGEEAAPSHFFQNEEKSPAKVGRRKSRMIWFGGGGIILLALATGFFLLWEYFPDLGPNYDKGDVGAIEEQPRGEELDRTFGASEQSIPLAKAPSVASEEAEVNLGHSDRSAEPDVQAADKRRQQGIDAGGDGEERRVYSVHVGSFKMKNNADRLVERLTRIGYNAREEFISLPQKGSWYRVLVGTFNTREDAKTLFVRLKDEEDLPALVIEGKTY